MSDLQALKVGSKARESEEKRLVERRRATLVLILRHLADYGYSESYERLSTEANLSLNRVDAADNIDLLRIVQDFEESYEIKFGKKPKLVRKLVEEVVGGGGALRPSNSASFLPPVPHSGSGGGHSNGGVTGPSPPSSANKRTNALEGPAVGGAMAARQRRERGSAAEDARKAEMLERRQNAMDSVTAPPEIGGQRIAGVMVGAGGKVLAGVGRDEVAAMQIQGMNAAPVRQVPKGGGGNAKGPRQSTAGDDSSDDPDEFFEHRILKPIPASLQGELRDLALILQRDIFNASPNVRWDDVAGLDDAKRLLKEAVVAPIKYPHLFTGLLAPWKGVLLYGPPGTGKTLLAKAVATECRTTFFNISASSIISKWRGDSEKLVRVLFELARHHAPSTIFIDEVDALMQARGGEGEHEASRRMKTELLTQIDGMAGTKEQVFLLAATNLPWELDAAMLRRLEKRILVTLPTEAARRAMLVHLFEDRCDPKVSMDDAAKRTEGFSGSDVRLVAKEAAMRPLRRVLAQLDSNGALKDVPAKLEAVSQADVDAAIKATTATGMQFEKEYALFTKTYGQVV